MKTFEGDGQSTHCGTLDEWKKLLDLVPEGENASVLDLRTGFEIGEDSLGETPKDWTVRRLPVSGATLSEQDVDVFRRELYRHKHCLVISPNDTRGPLLALAGTARAQRKDIDKNVLDGLQDLKQEKETLAWLESYLERHKSTEVRLAEE